MRASISGREEVARRGSG